MDSPQDLPNQEGKSMAALMWIIVFLFLISLTYWFFTHRLAAWSGPRSEGEEVPSLHTLFPWLTHRRLLFVVGGLMLCSCWSSRAWWSFVQDREV